jgi:tRNA threonylcarbamoyladenosine biosynthesis protein TsaB
LASDGVRRLVIETATSACSVALIEDGVVIASDAVVVGRGHAERLLPMVAALPDGGRADEIWVDCGPGSFTGIRVGIAAARGLGFGWGVPVAGYSSMALIAAEWFARNDAEAVTVVIEGGHGEVFVQEFEARPLRETTSLASVSRADHVTPRPSVVDAKPDASNAVRLAEAPLAVRPIYGRAPDAKPLAVAVSA